MAKTKARVRIYVDEVYPVYFIDIDSSNLSVEVDIDEELYQKYVKAKKAWDEVQAELKAIY